MPLRVLWLLSFLAVLVACHTDSPPTRPEATCRLACGDRASHCTEHECARGCTFILDRLVERETDRVVNCVGRKKTACDDPVWAECAVAVGVHADGGPPAPAPPED